MSDLVERLRRKAAQYTDEPLWHAEIRLNYTDAADEIERLRQTLKAIKDLTDTGEPDWNDAIGMLARRALGEAKDE